MGRTLLASAALVVLVGLIARLGCDVEGPPENASRLRTHETSPSFPRPPSSSAPPNVFDSLDAHEERRRPVETSTADAHPVAFEIVVLDPADGQPIADAVVSVGAGSGMGFRSLEEWTSFAGKPETAKWRDGAYRWERSAPARGDSPLAISGTTLIDIRREPDGPLVVPQLVVRAEGPVTRVITELGFRGRWSRPVPGAGALAEWLDSTNEPALDASGRTAALDRTKTETGVLFQLVGADGRTATEELNVTLLASDESRWRQTRSGWVAFDAPPGRLRWGVRAGGGPEGGPGAAWAVPRTGAVSVVPGERTEVVVQEPAVREIEIRTEDRSGRAVPHALVEVRCDDWPVYALRRLTAARVHEPYARTDADGRGVFAPIPAETTCEVEASFGRRHGRVLVEPNTRFATIVLDEETTSD